MSASGSSMEGQDFCGRTSNSSNSSEGLTGTIAMFGEGLLNVVCGRDRMVGLIIQAGEQADMTLRILPDRKAHEVVARAVRLVGSAA